MLRVRRETSEGGDRLSFAVQDTGIGMSEEQLGRLFQRFSQADESTTRKFGGTGLGLALTRAFAKLLGGDVTVVSTEGRGTCFTLSIPAVACALELEEPEAEGGGRRGTVPCHRRRGVAARTARTIPSQAAVRSKDRIGRPHRPGSCRFHEAGRHPPRRDDAGS